MVKIAGFNESYNGLKEDEAWQRIYESGKNLMPIKEHTLQKKYNRMFSKKTRVIRDGILTKVNTERLVPGDIIILERGEFVPVDGKVLEENALEFDYEFSVDTIKFNTDINEKIIYQGMRVKRGKVIIEAIRTGDNTYLGDVVKKLDKKHLYESNLEKILQKYFNIIGILGIILLLFGAIFSFVTGEGNIIDRLVTALYSGLLLFLAAFPIGAIVVLCVKVIEQKGIMRKSNLIIKKPGALLKAHKTTVICLDERFLSRNYEKYIQRLYSSGTMIAVITKKNFDEIKDIAKNAGIFEGDVASISGDELCNMKEEEFYRTICNTVIFYKTNNQQKIKIMQGFKELNIKTIGIVDGIEDAILLEYANVSVCTHHKKKNLEYEFSDATIIGTDLSSLYSLIKGSRIVKSYLKYYMKYYIMFQLPVVVSLLVSLLANLDFKVFYLQTLIFIMVIIPLLLLLINKDYSKDLLEEHKNIDKKFIIECIKFGFIGVFLSVLSIGLYVFLSKFNILDVVKISSIVVMLTIINATIVMISREKGLENKKSVTEPKIKKKDDTIKVNENKMSKEVNKEKLDKKSAMNKKIKKNSNIEDMKNQIM